MILVVLGLMCYLKVYASYTVSCFITLTVSLLDSSEFTTTICVSFS